MGEVEPGVALVARVEAGFTESLMARVEAGEAEFWRDRTAVETAVANSDKVAMEAGKELPTFNRCSRSVGSR